MNYRDILEAAFDALKDGENKSENVENKTGQAVSDKQAGKQSVTDTETESNGQTAEKTDAAKGGIKPAAAAAKAAELIKQFKSQASAAAHELDTTRAEELDGLAEVLDEICEIFRSGF